MRSMIDFLCFLLFLDARLGVSLKDQPFLMKHSHFSKSGSQIACYTKTERHTQETVYCAANLVTQADLAGVRQTVSGKHLRYLLRSFTNKMLPVTL